MIYGGHSGRGRGFYSLITLVSSVVMPQMLLTHEYIYNRHHTLKGINAVIKHFIFITNFVKSEISHLFVVKVLMKDRITKRPDVGLF